MKHSHSLDPCAGDASCQVPPAEFVRLRYFFGQRLGVVDLADEQAYVVGKQRFHNLRLHGVGVLCGLRAERFVFPQTSPASSPTTVLRVRRGAALDGCGREIVVGWDQCIDVAAWYAQHPAAHPPPPPAGEARPPLRLWVVLCYRECPSDPAPAPRDPCGCDAGGCEYARIREGFELKLVTDAEAALLAPAAPAPGLIGLPATELLDQPIEAAYFRALTEWAGGDCTASDAATCLVLANFLVEFDGATERVQNVTAPDNAIPERRSLLPTSLLQQGQLRALGAAATAEWIGPGPRYGAVTFAGSAADAGTLSIAIQLAADAPAVPLAPSPITTVLQVRLNRFQTDQTWQAMPAPTSFNHLTTPDRLELRWDAGLDEGRYRLVLENDGSTPVVDTQMRVLTPLRWARHFRLVKDAGGNLSLATSLNP